jgi:hypothetical protein
MPATRTLTFYIFQGVGKRDYWLSGNMFWGFNAWNQTSLFPHHLDYYRDTEGSTYSGLGINTDAYYPRPYSDNAQYRKNQQNQTRYLQSGAYIRLKICNSAIRFQNLDRKNWPSESKDFHFRRELVD